MDDKNDAQQKSKKDIGCIGLGRMGYNLVQNFLDHCFSVAAYDRQAGAVERLQEERKKDSSEGMLATCSSLEDLAGLVNRPRTVLLLVPAGKPVDDVLDTLVPVLEPDDIVIDGGNSYFKDSIRRAAALREEGVYFLDMGTSGGIEGARHGPCLMFGGDPAAYERAIYPFLTIAQKGGCVYTGPSGTGHFVKMVHNFIEYGIAQCIGEGVELLRAGKKFFSQQPGLANLAAIVGALNNGSIIESRLLGHLAAALSDPAFGNTLGNELEKIAGRIGGGETGEWALAAALELEVPVPANSAALFARYRSRMDESFAGKCVAAMRRTFGGHEVAYK